MAIPATAAVPGTQFTVDWHSNSTQYSFLSHAHDDHLAGIRGIKLPHLVFCSEITRALISARFSKIAECLRSFQVGEEFEIEGVKIMTFNANHTPGSVMFLFTLTNGEKILHTGDFRAEASVISSIRPFAPIDKLYIDTTFGTTNIDIPPRGRCVQFIKAISKNLLSKGYTILFGTYNSGKEDVVVEVATSLGCQVYTNEKRMVGIKSLQEAGSLSKRVEFVNDPSAKIHLVFIDTNAAEYDSEKKIAMIKLTGWSGRRNWEKPAFNTEKLVLYNIPYSDHSSVEELKAFVTVASPSAIVSTTSKSPKDVSTIQKIFLPLMRRGANKQFIDFFLVPKKKVSEKK